MGLFKVKFKVCSTRDPNRCKEVEGLVDTGAIISVVPKRILEELGIEPIREQDFGLATCGLRVRRKIGAAFIKININGKELVTNDEVIFGEEGDTIILGATVLEKLGLKVDPKEKKIIEHIAHL
ncbi:MAG: retroviral-like aspartic protease family protein [Candidatus Njordarchaeales archaeon]